MNAEIAAEILPEDPLYPKTAAQFLTPPPVLWARGNLELLQEPATVGFCGSRRISPKGAKAARRCVLQLCKEMENIVVVSGNAPGADFTAHAAALEFGAKTIFVLPEGIARFRIHPKLRKLWDWNKVLVVSQFHPNAVWKIWHAMRRNYLILALSKAMVVVEAQQTGGTKAAADAALQHKVPLFVIAYKNAAAAPGNARLYRNQNAAAIGKTTTGEANIAKLLQTINRPPPANGLIA